MANRDMPRSENMRWDDPMLVRAFDSALQKYQEMHGHPVEPLPKDPYSSPFKQEDTEGSLDHLRENDLQKRRGESAASVEEVEEEAESDVNESELESLILAAHIDEGNAEEVESGETFEASVGDPEPQLSGADSRKHDEGSEIEAKNLEGPEIKGVPAQQESEYTVEQYYEWLQWQASQQGATDAAETHPPPTTIIHHHHYYYPVAGPPDASPESVPTATAEQGGAVKTSPSAPAPAVANDKFKTSVSAASPQDYPAWPTFQLPQNPPLEQHSVPAGPAPCASSTHVGILNVAQEQSSAAVRRTNFEPTLSPDGGDSGEKLMTVTAMPEYESKSLEELRLQGYPRGTRGVKYHPTSIEDWGFPPEMYQCLTAMEAYRNKSLEELRWEDHAFLGDLPGSWVRRDGDTSPQAGVQGFVFPSAGEGEPSVCEGRTVGTQEDGAVCGRLVSEYEGEGTASGTEWKARAEQPAGVSNWQEAATVGGDAPRPSSVLAGAVAGAQADGALPQIDPVLQDLLSAYYWMGYQTARYLHSRNERPEH
ncbi:hypothetical protein KFL_000280060 [Klebsormidium nitens]|uniref:Uncharacterized protein n=1 Tax=Klebsormidium nitens TaxID=105231 RepID=A0A1Y1HQN6_KLENI|nr:hypothetical protein KFL_000280060 [Klebsormidium nitens]|eukprot:GAQ79301.1 hypothetical protein KFL_000280060 [Klebsormidium nitens]